MKKSKDGMIPADALVLFGVTGDLAHKKIFPAPYARLLGDAMAGEGALFTREDAVEAAWAVVDPVLKTHRPVHPYKPGSWGPKQAAALIAADGNWHNPILATAP